MEKREEEPVVVPAEIRLLKSAISLVLPLPKCQCAGRVGEWRQRIRSSRNRVRTDSSLGQRDTSIVYTRRSGGNGEARKKDQQTRPFVHLQERSVGRGLRRGKRGLKSER